MSVFPKSPGGTVSSGGQFSVSRGKYLATQRNSRPDRQRERKEARTATFIF